MLLRFTEESMISMVEIGECKINPVLNKDEQSSFEGVARKIWIKPEKHPIAGGLTQNQRVR